MTQTASTPSTDPEDGEGGPAAAVAPTGARRVGAALAQLDDEWTVLRDRLLRPGESRASLDHVVIGPSGMFLVEVKDREGRIIAWEGGLFQRITHGGYRQTVSLAGDLATAQGKAAAMSDRSERAVTPVVCLAGPQEAHFGEPRVLRGVWVVPVSLLTEWLLGFPTTLAPDLRARVVSRAMTDFPSSTTDPELLRAIGDAAERRRARRGRLGFGAAGGARKPRGLTTGGAQALGLVQPTGALQPSRSAQPTGAESDRAESDGSRPAGSTRRRLWNRSSVTLRAAGAVLSTGVLVGLGVGLVPEVFETVDAPAAAIPSPAIGAPDCNSLNTAQLSEIVGRQVQPVATSDGCAWGTRLDDPGTVLLSVQTYAADPVSVARFHTSAAQQRVVYGTDPGAGAGAVTGAVTALWVAVGEPLGADAGAERAEGDTHVVVWRTALHVSDDQARAMALAVARAVNAAPR